MFSWLKWLLAQLKAWFQVVMGASEHESLQAPVDDPLISALLQASIEYPPISSSLGPIDRLMRRLQSLVGSKHTLPKGLISSDIVVIGKHLKEFRNPLKNLSEMDATSFRAKWWMKEVRELCYDTEDYLEEVMMQSGGGAYWSLWNLGRTASTFVYWIGSKLKCRRPKLSQFTDRATDLKEILPNCLDEENKAAIPPNKVEEADTCPHKEHKTGVETLPSELVNQLAFDDDKQTQLKVVAISGSAGAGKTALASTVYVKYKLKFQCRAFARVSRNPDFRSLLTSILSQIKAPPPHDFPDVQGLTDSINKHLQRKRYFIVIDDVRSPSVWDIISRVFPGGDFCSRIIVTTQSEQVEAAYSGYELESAIFKMHDLNDGCTESTSEKKNELKKNKVVKLRYHSLPLHLKTCLLYLSIYPEGSTITKDDLVKQWVAEGFIAELKMHHTEDISEVHQNKTVETSEVSSGEISGAPQDQRDEIAEVPQDQREEIEEAPQDEKGEIAKVHQDKGEKIAEVPQNETEKIARGYFDELVTRGMIQPVHRNHKGELLSCTVHHMVLDLIRLKSREDNFIVVVDNHESTVGHPDIVRRLSIQFGSAKGASIPESIILSKIRSLIFYGFLGCVPSIMDYGLLRVLILNIWAGKKEIFDLNRIGELYQLTYLKIECNITVKLPSKIRRLRHLSTLQVDARLCDVPTDIVHLEKLLHLCLPSESILPHGIGRMTSLRTLGYFDIGSNSEDNVRGLDELKNLQDLQLTCSTGEPAESQEKSIQLLLVSVLQKLSFLQSVTLAPTAGSSPVNIPCDGFSIVSPHMSLILRRIELSRRCCIFFSLPQWLGLLRKLSILKIGVRSLSKKDIDIMKELPALTALTLYILKVPKELIVFDKGFPVLTYFKFTCAVPCLYFLPGAMLNVQKLKLGFNAVPNNPFDLRSTDFIELTSLTEICVKCGTRDADEFHRIEAPVLERAVSYHPNTPIVSLQCVDVVFYGEEEKDEIEEEVSEEDKNDEVDKTYEIEAEGSEEDKNNEVEEKDEIKDEGSAEVSDSRKRRSSTRIVHPVGMVVRIVKIVEIVLKTIGVLGRPKKNPTPPSSPPRARWRSPVDTSGGVPSWSRRVEESGRPGVLAQSQRRVLSRDGDDKRRRRPPQMKLG